MKIAFVRENQQMQKRVTTMFFTSFALDVFLMCSQQGLSVAFLDAEKIYECPSVVINQFWKDRETMNLFFTRLGPVS